SSSLMIGLPISSISVVPMPEVNSSPQKLTAPQGLFEAVPNAQCSNPFTTNTYNARRPFPLS
ncbi:MAG: hypothetical protein VB138_07590, partial [Burkholderia sp.]